jgi:4-hydroxy-tetrahydrodipicolinate reductase
MENQPTNPLKIALIGYGKMGKTIEALAPSAFCKVVFVGGRDWLQHRETLLQSGAQIAIEFTAPESAASNLLHLIDLGIPTVCGSTGWANNEAEVKEACQKNRGSILVGSNFSLGVLMFFALNKKLAKWMAGFPEYAVRLTEIHHTQKKDAPSGTAVTIANGIVEQNPAYTDWELYLGKETKGLVPITAKRQDEVKGIHSITWDSEIDQLELRHLAHSRGGFALGALRAARWLYGKQGWYGVEDMYVFE